MESHIQFAAAELLLEGWAGEEEQGFRILVGFQFPIPTSEKLHINPAWIENDAAVGDRDRLSTRSDQLGTLIGDEASNVLPRRRLRRWLLAQFRGLFACQSRPVQGSCTEDAGTESTDNSGEHSKCNQRPDAHS